MEMYFDDSKGMKYGAAGPSLSFFAVAIISFFYSNAVLPSLCMAAYVAGRAWTSLRTDAQSQNMRSASWKHFKVPFSALLFCLINIFYILET
jgi:hypothetical protein